MGDIDNDGDLEIVISNAVLATLLAVVAAAITRIIRRPQLAFWLWMLHLPKSGVSDPCFRNPCFRNPVHDNMSSSPIVSAAKERLEALKK